MRRCLARYAHPAGVIVFAGLVYVFAPLVETVWRPVVTPLEITGHESVPGGVELQGRAHKLRDCAFRELEWFLGTRESGRGVPLSSAGFRDRPQERLPGLLQWERIYVPLTIEQVETNSYADVLHRCYATEEQLTRSRYWN